jgi:hypothetical protein
MYVNLRSHLKDNWIRDFKTRMVEGELLILALIISSRKEFAKFVYDRGFAIDKKRKDSCEWRRRWFI